MTPSLYIVDGHAYSYQAFFALKGITAPDGTPTNAVFGFIRLIEKIRNNNPDYLVVCFDAPGPTFRSKIYKDYKATRKPMPDEMRVQLPLIKELLAAYSVPVVELPGYEADDLMATIAQKAGKEGKQVFLYTPDKDISQIVDETIKVFDSKKDKIVDIEEVVKNYGLEPDRLKEYFALVGDSADNIPGVKGIGPKTANTLLQKWQTLEDIYQNIEQVKTTRVQNLLKKHREEAFLSRKLFTIESNAPITIELEDYRVRNGDTEKLRNLYQKLGFHTLLAKLKPLEVPELQEITLVDQEDQWLKLHEIIKQKQKICVELDGDEQKIWNCRLRGIAIAWGPKQAAYIKFADSKMPKEKWRNMWRVLLEEGPAKIGYDLKSIYRMLYQKGIIISPLAFDATVAEHLASSYSGVLSRDRLCLQYLGEKGQTGEKDYKHFCIKACQSYRLAEKMAPRLEQSERENLFRKIELPLIPVLVEMELSGVQMDEEWLERMARDLKDRVNKLEQKIHQEAGEKFNIASSQQLANILFEKLGLPTGKKTKKGYSTNSEVLEELKEHHVIPKLVLEQRRFSKLLNTYVEALPKYQNEQTGKIHTIFHQTGTITGRLSSSDPNLQNIPIKTEEGQKIRKAFMASKNHLLVTADYSQIELRVLAHYSQDPKLLEAFAQGKDIHASVAADIFGVKVNEVTESQRRIAKTVNFGIIYGQSAFGLSKELQIPMKEAQEFIQSYFEHYSYVREFIEKLLEQARENQYVETLFKRRRYLPEINAAKHQEKKFAERTAVNTVMQGTAADIIKNAMVNIYRERNERMMIFKILLQIHDELIFEVPQKQVTEVANMVRKNMMETLDLSVPLAVKICSGKNWFETSPLPGETV